MNPWIKKYGNAAAVLALVWLFLQAVGGGESVCYVSSPDAALCTSDNILKD